MTYSILAPASRPVVDMVPLPDDHHEAMSERGITLMTDDRRDVNLKDTLELWADAERRRQQVLVPGETAASGVYLEATAETRRGRPRCPVAEFVGDELDRIAAARAEHLRQCQMADQAGLPRPDLDNFMPERVWTKERTIPR
jgi:hypothetical protein